MMIDDADTKPVVSPQRLRDASNGLTCIVQSRWVARSAGEWLAGAAPQVEDPNLRALLLDAVADWHRWESRVYELQLIAMRHLEALRYPPRVTQGPEDVRR